MSLTVLAIDTKVYYMLLFNIFMRDVSTEADQTLYCPTVEYTVEGNTYTSELDESGSGYLEGKTIDILYDPANPWVIHAAGGFGVAILVTGIIVLLMPFVDIAISSIRRKEANLVYVCFQVFSDMGA